MSEYKPVPVDVAKLIAEDYTKSIVVILAYDSAHELTHTTTYGVSAFDKENAAAIGERCTKAIGADLSEKISYEDFHNDYDPARFKEALEVLHRISKRNYVDQHDLRQIQTILNSPTTNPIASPRP